MALTLPPHCFPTLSHGFHATTLLTRLSSHPALAITKTSRRTRISAVQEKKTNVEDTNVEEVTKKFGLEAGLWKIFTSKKEGSGQDSKENKTNQTKQLLAKYGGAYLLTSISLSVLSFSVCYVLINAGVDVQSLLEKVGIHTDQAGEKVGTLALAYAVHKAASPIRFPPTVALTPIVASWFGNKNKKQDKRDN